MLMTKVKHTVSFFNAGTPTPTINDRVIYNIVTAHEGEALGHDLIADKETLRILAVLGNASKVRARFGHPGISENAMGRKIGEARNFRMGRDAQGNVALLHDLHFYRPAKNSPVFTQDPIQYVVDMAKEYPTEIGNSVVIGVDAVWVLQDGSEVEAVDYEPPPTATTALPIMRPTSFDYSDIVSEGALTHNGMFEQRAFANTTSAYLSQIFAFADEFRVKYKMSLEVFEHKAKQAIKKYVGLRSHKQEVIMASKGVALETDNTDELLLEDELVDDVEQDTVTSESDDVVHDDLDEALDATTDVSDDLDDDTVDEVDNVADVSMSVIHQLTARVNYLEGLLEKVIPLATGNAKNVKRLHEKVASIADEPLVSVPLQAGKRGVPSALRKQKPRHVSERMSTHEAVTGFPNQKDDPVLSSLGASFNRSGGGNK